MSTTPASPFSTEVVEAIKAHMNRDHAGDSLVICRTLGRQPAATAAWVEGVDAAGVDFVAAIEGAEIPIRLAWSQPLSERGQVRAELVAMTDQARRAAGLPERSGSLGEAGGH